jgi:N-acetylglucosaminyldiphosphoundecaprenol N-acetyl-beta-D-mannosaminyltransferase
MPEAIDAIHSRHAGKHRLDILGVRVEPWTPELLIDAMVARARGAQGPFGNAPATVLYANVHVLNLAFHDAALRKTLNEATTVYCDGSGVRVGARLLRGDLPPRLTSVDWIDPLCRRLASEGVGVYLVGGADGVARRAEEVLRTRHPTLDVRGTHHGFPDAVGSERLVAKVNEAGPGMLVVGMGTPTQEAWISRYREGLTVPVVWGVGALLDFLAGVQRRGPRWMTENHLEWLWRLGTNPKRMWRRYVVGNPVFLARVMRQATTPRRRPDGRT